MSELGDSVIKAVEFLASFHRDVAKLIGCVEDTMRNRGFVPIWGSTSVWERSWAFNSPNGWMPRYLCRVYVPMPPGGEAVDNKSIKALAFFIIYLTPRLAKEPAALWGSASLVEPVDPWPLIKQTLLRDEGPTFLKTATVPGWEKLVDRPEKLESLIYRACPLIALSDSATVERTVVGPLVEAFPPT
jgi:hypothetical protein